MTTQTATPSPLVQSLPFALPFLVFIAALWGESFFPDQHYLLYPIKTLLVVAVLAYYWRVLPSLRPSAPLVSIAVGVVGIVIWVGLDPAAMHLNGGIEHAYNNTVAALGLPTWQTHIDTATPGGRNPFQIYPLTEAWTLFGLRLLGISLCVPIMEELFWRGFLMRWLIAEDFTAIPLGTYRPLSFWLVTLFFATEHGPQWLLGLIVGILFGAWFVRTKNLGNVIVAHGITNLMLALYCLFTNDWHFLAASPAPVAK